MNARNSKDTSPLPFSFIDVFLLLLAGLVVSFGIYFLAEEKKEDPKIRYQVELSCTVKSELSHALPAPGESLYGEDGEKTGEVLFVETEEDGGGKILLRVRCSMEGPGPRVGDEILLETQSCVRNMRIDSVKEEGDGKL